MDAHSEHSGNLPVVTLFGKVGAGVEAVGRLVADRLGLPYHPQAFSSDAIAGSPGAQAEERATLAKIIEVLSASFGGTPEGEEARIEQLREELVAGNTQLVHQRAAQGGVIVGRNGALLLADRPNAVNVLLTGEDEACHRRAAAELRLPLQQAASRARREDQVRADMSMVLYAWDPRDSSRYDLVIDTSRVPIIAAVEAIVAAVAALRADSASGNEGLRESQR